MDDLYIQNCECGNCSGKKISFNEWDELAQTPEYGDTGVGTDEFAYIIKKEHKIESDIVLAETKTLYLIHSVEMEELYKETEKCIQTR